MQDFKNIQTVKYFIFSILGIIFFISSCKKEIVEEVIYDNIIYQIDTCLLYTSDAADERSSVDLVGRRIIKKKNTYEYTFSYYIP